MLTRLEVDGFKNLLNVAVDLGPFTCIAGPNGVGKSNLFDAIRFLALLSQHRIMDAARLVRGTDDDPTNPADLFNRATETPTGQRSMRLAAEMIVPWNITDLFGGRGHPSITFLRYEVGLRYSSPSGTDRYGSIALVHESLVHINQGDAHLHLRWPHSAQSFRRRVVRGARRGGAFISTDDTGEMAVIKTHQDGGSRGKPRPTSAEAATATVVGATTSVDDPTVFAVKQEMASWKLLALEPSAMRRPDRYWEAGEATSVTEKGAHIPGSLWQLADTDPGREDLCARVAASLSELLPVAQLRVVPNDANQQYELELREPRGSWMGARALSEGTLRFLALATLAADPGAATLLCMEEPENGIHPLRIPAILDLLDQVAVDPHQQPGDDNPLRQVVINTHSPRLVQELEANERWGDLLIAERSTVRLDTGVGQTVRFRHRAGSWRAHTVPGVGPGVAIEYLTTPRGAQGELLGQPNA